MSVRRVVIGLAVLAPLVVGGLWWRATWVARHLLRVEAPKSIAEKSGGVYQVNVGRVRFNLARRHINVDSIQVTTNEAINAARPRPRATLRLAFHQCTISGMHLMTLILGRGLIADSFGCADVSGAAQVPRGAPDTTTPPSIAGGAFFALQQGLQLPSFAPRVDVALIEFPHVGLDVRLQRARGGEARIELEHLQWRMSDFVIDPADSSAVARPLFSRKIELMASNFVAHPGSATAVRVEGFRASLTDSTLELRGIAYAPPLSDSAFAKAQPYRRSLVKAAVGRMTVQGLDVGALVLRQGLRARRVELDSLRLDILSDRRRRLDPTPPTRRTPQAWIADLERNISTDSVLVRDGEIAYRELRPRHAKPGMMTFARLEVVAVNVRHVNGRRSTGNPMTLHATAYLQNDGRLDAQFVVPLDAPRFNMTFRGKLGAMPATSLNAFIHETFPLRLAKGRIKEIVFGATVTNGVAEGTVTPLYNDLTVEVTGRGSGGILGTGGVIGDAARGIATFVGNLTEMQGDNPDDGETAPRRGTINHTFTPTETLPAFLWISIRDGLFAVVRK